MLSHEKDHFNTFDSLLRSRCIRHCYAINLWAIGGFVLGLFTACLGRNAIWVCTNSIESTVLHHLDWQLDFLARTDLEAYNAVLSIKADEESHQQLGQANGHNYFGYRILFTMVCASTEFAIWLSTKL